MQEDRIWVQPMDHMDHLRLQNQPRLIEFNDKQQWVRQNCILAVDCGRNSNKIDRGHDDGHEKNNNQHSTEPSICIDCRIGGAGYNEWHRVGVRPMDWLL